MTTDHFHTTAPFPRNRLVWLCVVTAIVLVGIVFGVRIFVDYRRTISRSEEHLLIQTKVVDENITTNLTLVNVMLNSIINELEGAPAKNQLNSFLKQLLVMTPGIRTLMVTDQQGRCLYSNREELLGKDFPRDRDYFTIPRDASDKKRLFLSSPYTTLLGKYVVNITKARIGTQDEFKGVVTATLDPAYISALLSSTISTPDNRVSLVHSDGTVFIAVPEAKVPVTGMKVTQPGSAFLQHISGGSATTIRRAPGKTLGDQRIFAYRTNTPQGVQFDKRIVVAASRNLHEVLATWRMDTAIDLLIYLLFASVSIVITELLLRRGSELKRLEDTQAHLAAIVQFSDDAIISKDLDGAILSWNSGAERLFNYHQEEVIGHPITILVPPERLEEENRILQQLNSGKPVEHIETVRIAKDGRPIEVSVTSSPLKDNSGKIIGVSKIIRDITERKQSLEALQESETRFRTMANAIPQLAWIARGDGHIFWYNQRWYDYTGTLPEQMEGWGWQSVHDPAELPKVMERWQTSIAAGERFDMTFPLRGADGIFRPFLTRIIPLKDAAGRVTQWFGTNTDVNELKCAEQALKESEERLSFALETIHTGAWDLDLDDHSSFRSLEHDRIFGYPDVLPEWTYEMFLEHVLPEDRETVNNKFRYAMENRSDWNFECRIRRTDGELRWIWAAGRHRNNKGAAPRRMAGIVQDITDRKLTAEALQESRHDLDRAQEVGKIGCWRLDVRSNVLTWSDENHRIFGIPKGLPLSYESFLATIHPDDRPYVDAQWQAGLRGEPYDIEHRLLVAGQVKWVREKAYLEFEKDGSLIGGFGITQDITQRKLAEEELLKAHAELEQRVAERTVDLAATVEALLAEIDERQKIEASLEKTTREVEDLYNLAPCGYHSLDKDGTFIRINDTELHWIGYTRDEVVGKMKFTEILTPESRETFAENFLVFMKSGQLANVRYEFVHKDGTVLPILLNASAITDENGAYLMSRSSSFDITELTQAQNSLQRLNSLYAMLSETNQTIVRTDTDNRNELFSAFCRIAVEHGRFLLAWVGLVDETTGEVRRVAAYGKTSYLEDIRITATDEPAGEGPTGIAIRNGSCFISNDFQNDPLTTPWHERGKAHGIYASASVALKEEGRVTGALTIYAGEKEYFDKQQVQLLHQMGMDISYALENFNREARRLEAEQSLQLETAERLRTLETLREKEQLLLQQSRQAAMGEMIGNIAHQWRQPLNTLGLYTQRLGFFFGTPQFNKDFLDRSVAKSMEIIQHMSKTIDDFRNYFKPEKEKTDFHVIEAINNALSLLDGSLQNPKISIEIVERDTPVINGYKNEFAQVLLNLLVNARDAIIAREIEDGRITITLTSENGGTVVTVADNAGGIPEEIISKIFDPYFTTKGPQHGTGVGLFMSKAIIEKNMGGRLTVRNTADGAEFRIEIGTRA